LSIWFWFIWLVIVPASTPAPFLPLMKALFFLTLLVGVVFSAQAQTPGVTYTAAQLDQLVAPIALYPDPLVALILPAATVPNDLAEAANYLAVTGDPAGIDSQPWDPSVKGLAHYPEVLNWMNDNLAWTETLGAAFLQQPADVLKSIQQLRAEALAAGTLVNTPQQQIDVEGDDIRIIPTQEDTIYVPAYDPSVVYTTPPSDSGPYVTFGSGYPVGAWLAFQCDWDGFGIWVGPWTPGWAYRREWRQPTAPKAGWRSWQPDPHRSYETVHNAYRPEYHLPSPGVVTRPRQPAGDRPFGGIRPVAVQPVRGLPHATLNAPPPVPDYRGRFPAPRNPASEPQVLVGGAVERGRGNEASAPEPGPAEAAGTRRTPGIVTSSPPRPAPAGAGRSPGIVTSAPPSSAPASPVFGGYSRGADARDSSNRGQASRAEPVRAPPSAAPVGRSAPAPASAPASRAPAAGSGGEYKNRQ